MAAGAIPPPLFFERLPATEHICVQHIGSGNGILRGIRNTRSVDHVLKRPARAFAIESERSPV